MQQAIRQAVKGAIPVLIYRLDRQKWVAELRAGDVLESLQGTASGAITMTMPLALWITLVREKILLDN